MNTMLWLCAAGAIGIFGVMLHSVATFGSQRDVTGRYKRNAMREVIWALVPILIVIAAAVPSFRHSAPTTIAVAASD